MAGKSAFEIAVIDEVKKIRVAKGMTQDDLAEILDVSRGFIGQIESPNSIAAYNLDHLNRLAAAMKCSPKDFMPNKAMKG